MNMNDHKCIGKGTMARVYLIDGKAYKLYFPFSFPENITKEKISLYKTIPTKRIILANQPLLNKKGKIRGYISQYIKNLGMENFLQLEKSKILEELKILREDFILLGEYGVKTDDINIENTIFHDGLYFIDCGRFKISDETGYDSVTTTAYNLDDFDHYFLYDLMCMYGVDETKHAEYVKIYKDNLSKDVEILDYLQEDMTQKENFGQYVKRKVM